MRTSAPREACPQTLLGVFLNAGILALGSVLAQLLLLLVSPLLTRLYPPVAFGLFGMITGIMSAPGAAANFRFDQVIMLPRSRRSASTALSLSLILPGVFALLVTLLALAARGWLERRGLADLLWYGGPWLLAYAGQQALAQWMIRGGYRVWTAVAQVVRSAAVVICQIAFSFLGLGGQGLLLGLLVGQVLAVAVLLPRARPRIELHRRGLARMRALIRRHANFPLYGTPQSFFESLTSQLPPTLIGLLLGVADAGQYWLAVRILTVPSGIVESALYNAFYRKLAEDHRQGRSHLVSVTRLSLALAALGAVPMLIFAAFGPEIFSMVFGAVWRHAGEDARWLAIWSFTAVVSIPWATVVPVLGLQRPYLVYSAVTAVIRLGTIAIAGSFDAPLVVPGYCIASVVSLLSLIAYICLVLWRQSPVTAGGRANLLHASHGSAH